MTSKVIRKERCPECAKAGRDNNEDNLAVYDDGHSHCYACSYHQSGKQEFINLSNSFSYEYLPTRGITKETMAFYDVKTKIDAEGKPIAIGFKYPNLSMKVRDLTKKDFHTQGDIAKAGLFGRDKFSSGGHKYVTITEGEFDALSLHQVLSGPVVSVQSASSASRDCSADMAFLNSFERVYLAFDNDAAGRSALAAVARLFDPNKVYHVKFDRYKDANEYLQHNAGEELKKIWWNAKRYLPENILSDLAEFTKVLGEKPKWGVPYPFWSITEKTYGLRQGETVLITAQEGVGKTELMHAIEYKLLTETEDNVGAIFIEEPKRRHLQALAGLHLRMPVHLPDTSVDDGAVASALMEVVKKDERLHLYSHFGSDDPDVVLDAIRFMVAGRSCNWVLLDHINMVVSGLGGEKERIALDYLSTRLEMMVKELNFGLIMVAHVNDDGLTRSSRYIGKVADIRIDITRDLKSDDPLVRNTTNVMVAKNRYSGKTGPAGVLIFDPKTYMYNEEFPVGANDNVKIEEQAA